MASQSKLAERWQGAHGAALAVPLLAALYLLKNRLAAVSLENRRKRTCAAVRPS